MNYVIVEDGRITEICDSVNDPKEIPEGAILLNSFEYRVVDACAGNLDNGINALVSVAEKILAGTLAEKKAVIFPEDKV